MKKRLLSLFLALIMVLGMMPATALAAEGTETDPYVVSNETELKEALSKTGTDIYIQLSGDVSLSYGAREEYGGEETVNLVIDGGNHTLTLNQTDSDWSSIGLANPNGKLTLKNMTIEKGTSPGNGAWNNYAINIHCNVAMNNVTVNHSVALGEDVTASLNNVKITESGNYYCLLIRTGADVTVTECDFIAEAGRGIKVIDQYDNDPQETTLSVSNTTFETAKKAAILVTSTAAVEITLENNVDISGVAEDSANAVWVDEDRKDSADQVTVNGKSAVVEGSAQQVGLPTATVTELENEDLTFAMNFKADEVTDKQLEYFGDWYADFVLTVNKDVTFNANGGADGYLSGQYDAWSENWVNVPFEDVTLKANESLKIMEYASELMGKSGLKYTYGEVYQSVKDFDCGVFFTEAFMVANPDLKVTLSLRIYNPADETESYVIGDTYVFTLPVPKLPTATVTELENEDLTFALNFKADEVSAFQLAYYGDWYADFELTINKDVTFNANSDTADGYLSGQYDAWSENWVNVPFEDVALTANTPLKIMAYAASMMGQPGLQVTYNDVYTSVKDFDCGVFFSDEFLAANPDLVVTLALRMYNPADADADSVTIGEYVFGLPQTVTFDSAGGSPVEDQTVEYNGKATEPTAPIKPGYTFQYWMDEDGNKYDFDTPVTAPVTLIAKWMKNYYGSVSYNTVTFVAGDEYALEAQKGTSTKTDGSVVVTLSGSKLAETKIPDVIPADAYYEFVEWAVEDKDGDLVAIDLETYKFTKSTKVYAIMEDVWTPYVDMKQDRSDWYYQYVRDLSIAGVVNGVPGGAFAPADEVTWGVALKLIMLAVGYEEQAPVNAHWASGYLAAALRDGLVTAEQNIDLNATLTRLEYAQVAYKAMGLKDVKIKTPFADTDDAAVLALYKAGIFEGTINAAGVRVYNPDNNITRAEISTVIWRINKYED